MANKANRVINGSNGTAWINGELLSDVDSLELKVTLDYGDVNFSEDFGTYKKFLGWTGEGSIVFKKVYSRGINLLAEAVKTGKMPEITITSKLSDPDSYGQERVSVTDVTFNEFLLTKLEQRTLLQEELSFAFGDFDVLEAIK